jgi:PKD repeat protein
MISNNKKLVFVFVTLLIIISAMFILTNQFYETKYITKEDEKEISIMIYTDKTTGAAPLSVKFSSLISNSQDDLKYYWDFGDGEVSIETNPTHIYKEIGSYNCILTVIDSNGKKDIEQVNITATRNNPPLVKIAVDKTVFNRPVTIYFDASCFDVDGEIVSYKWEITEPQFFSYQNIDTYNEKNFSKYFIRPGSYEVKLTVIDDANNSVTEYLKLEIIKSKPELLFSGIISTITTITFVYNNLIKPILKAFNRAPNMPSNPFPGDNATGVDVNADISWSGDDPNPRDTTIYDIYFGTTSPPPLVISGHSNSNFELGTLLTNTTYYWKIVAIDKYSVTTTGPIWSFST